MLGKVSHSSDDVLHKDLISYPLRVAVAHILPHVLGKSFWRSRVKDRKKRFAGKSWNEIDHLLTK